MTLGELKEMIRDLERMYPEYDVNEMDLYTEYDYGDHSHTRALVVPTYIDICKPHQTAYSDSGLAIGRRDDEDDYDENEEIRVVVLKSNRR